MEDITQMWEKLKSLSPEDLKVLENIPDKAYTFVVELASQLDMLPSQVQNAIDRLQEEGFIQKKAEEIADKAKELASSVYALLGQGESEITLSEEGGKAQKLAPLLDKTEDKEIIK